MMETYDAKGVLQEMIREVVKIDSRDMVKDSSGLRNFAQFFTEVGEKSPYIFIPSLSLLVTFLQQEVLRECFVAVLVSFLLHCEKLVKIRIFFLFIYWIVFKENCHCF